MIRMVHRKVPILCAILLIFISCRDQHRILDRFEPIPNRAWETANQPEMTVHVSDNKVPHTIYVNLRHTHQYRYANIHLRMHVFSASDSGEVHLPAKEIKRIQLRLAENDGRWLGKQQGNLYTLQKPILKNYYFPDTGKFVIRMEQFMRDNPLEHVTEVGLRIDQNEPL